MSVPRHLLTAVRVAASALNRSDVRARRSYVGCVVVRKDGAVVMSRNVGWNVHVTSRKNPRGHAEARCARKSDVGSVAYVARVGRDGSVRLAKPCASCVIAMRARGVSKAFYTISEKEWGCVEL